MYTTTRKGMNVFFKTLSDIGSGAHANWPFPNEQVKTRVVTENTRKDTMTVPPSTDVGGDMFGFGIAAKLRDNITVAGIGATQTSRAAQKAFWNIFG